ncbi:MAG: hypothetical protein ACOYJH_02815 [Anaerovoracaceae bacterium]|jgi:hypothetical protein
MSGLKYRYFPEGQLKEQYIPIGIALVDYEDVLALGLTPKEACERIAKAHEGPVAINIWDMKTACTTTTNGIMYDGSIVAMAASDYGKINKEFGYLDMRVIDYDSDTGREIRADEPHLKQWTEYYPDRRIITSPTHKNVPVHMVAITGRAGNNNSATEMMHYINMEELLFPVGGQVAVMKGRTVEYGRTGGTISVGIGMYCAEKYGRIVLNKSFPTGTTAHGSGEYAKTLKAHIPIIVGEKPMVAEYIINALKLGLVPGRDIGGAPSVLCVAKAIGAPIAWDLISDAAKEELASVGLDEEWYQSKTDPQDPEEVIKNADRIIPGVKDPVKYDPADLYTVLYA